MSRCFLHQQMKWISLGSQCLPSVEQKQNLERDHDLKENKQDNLPFTKNRLGSEAALSKSSSLVIKLSRSNITSVATSQKVNDWNSKQFRETIIRLGSYQVGSQLKLTLQVLYFPEVFFQFSNVDHLLRLYKTRNQNRKRLIDRRQVNQSLFSLFLWVRHLKRTAWGYVFVSIRELAENNRWCR